MSQVRESNRGKFTPSAVAWLLVLSAILWFGGNYVFYKVLASELVLKFF